MDGFDPKTSFPWQVATRYDDDPRGDEEDAVARLASLAQDGPVLELGIGTGRIALPLAATGLRVDGIDLSEAMVARLREKPSGQALDVALGSFAAFQRPGPYALVFVVYNTLFNLLTQDEQVSCFHHVSRHLTPDGRFVVEAFVPSFLHRLREQQYVMAEKVALDAVTLDVVRHDPVEQLLHENHVTFREDGTRLSPIVTRYVWPSEMDLMARLAGLSLETRWGGWREEPFVGDSRLHVSVYRRRDAT